MNIDILPDSVEKILGSGNFSRSEKDGLNLITDKDLLIYSPGISTGGVAEIAMALDNSKRKIVASTLDKEGIREVSDYIKKSALGEANIY